MAILMEIKRNDIQDGLQQYFKIFRFFLDESDRDFITEICLINKHQEILRKEKFKLIETVEYMTDDEEESPEESNNKTFLSNNLNFDSKVDLVGRFYFDSKEVKVKKMDKHIMKLKKDLENKICEFSRSYQARSDLKGYYRTLLCFEMFRENKRCDLFFDIGIKNLKDLHQNLVQRLAESSQIQRNFQDIQKSVTIKILTNIRFPVSKQIRIKQ